MNFSHLILHQDNHLLAVNKPAGLATAHDEQTSHTLDHFAREYLRQTYAKPGNVFLGIVHRLDKPTSGVVLFARTSKAAARLSLQFREKTAQKTYLAIVSDAANQLPNEGTFRDLLVHDDAAERILIADAKQERQGKEAETQFRTRSVFASYKLLELSPKTGRKHQLRVQLSSRGMPILGDRKYGSHVLFPLGIALHAWQLSVQHPTRGDVVTLEAPLPSVWINTFPSWLSNLALPIEKYSC